MNNLAYNSLQLREIFHLELLRLLGRKMKGEHYVLKGGVNLRFFFNSFRYSEDMDTVYNSSAQWDEIRLKVVDFIEQFRK